MLKASLAALALMLGISSVGYSADDSLVTVQGTGVVYAKPDCLHVNVAVVGEHITAGKAYSLNKDVGTKVFAAIKSNSIDDADVSSIGFHFNRSYDQTGKPTGYQVVHRLSIKVKDIKTAGKVVDDVVNAGGALEGLQYVVSNRTEHLAKARAIAVADAKAKAEQIAKGLGTSVERVKAISEGSSYASRDVYSEGARPAAFGGGPQAVQLAAGDQAITVNVSASFVLK